MLYTHTRLNVYQELTGMNSTDMTHVEVSGVRCSAGKEGDALLKKNDRMPWFILAFFVQQSQFLTPISRRHEIVFQS